MSSSPPSPLLAGLTVLERGWLSSNNVVIHGAPGEAGAVLVDSGHVVHAAQTLALVKHALQRADGTAQPLARIVNTHLHSDHCGGNALLQRELAGVPIVIPPGEAEAVRQWDVERLSHDDFGRRERFTIAGTLAPGDHFTAAGRRWEAHAAPGHDPHSLVLFDATHGVLLSADALWANGFGVVFPELIGESGFAEVAATLDMIERLPVRLVVPGHGAPFADVAQALARARSRLAAFRADPARHARHAAKVIVKYHVMEERSLARAELLHWAATAPLVRDVWQRFGRGGEGAAASAAQWIDGFIDELLAAGVIGREPGGAGAAAQERIVDR
ncbi:MAG: MBL fold metallo-hydrolase [Rubrivivax sp.]|nr:MBL fold metallo-hydrolase [Rubrivivax sp.]